MIFALVYIAVGDILLSTVSHVYMSMHGQHIHVAHVHGASGGVGIVAYTVITYTISAY